MKSVSIITISEETKSDFLIALSKCIQKQDYQNIIEWIILDTSTINNLPNDLTKTILTLESDKSLPKIIYRKTNKLSSGGWRNELNSLAKGNIIVCMNDTNFYPENRVSHSVSMMNQSNKNISGCHPIYFFDVHYQKLYQLKENSNHPLANTLAYTKTYLENHSFDEKSYNDDCASFVNNIDETVCQLEAKFCGLEFSFVENNFFKKSIFLNYHVSVRRRIIVETEYTLENYINDANILDFYNKISSLKNKPNDSNYDIVYFIGRCVYWSPSQEDLGGSEQAVKYLSQEWANLGKKVAVYGNIHPEGLYQGVHYIDYNKFRFWDNYNILILWRVYGCVPYLDQKLNAKKLLIDIHDHDNLINDRLIKYKEKISTLFVKSVFQQETIEKDTNTQFNFANIPNGLRVDKILEKVNISRIKYRMCYCNCYTRGLERLLEGIWPIIYKLQPLAEFHIYYGMYDVGDYFETKMRKLLSQPGVMDHGRQPLNVITRERYMSCFHFYYTDVPEIDCISVRESLISGCIPILSDVSIYRNRDGIHLKWLPDTPENNETIANIVVKLMENDIVQKELSSICKNSPTITNWKETAQKWLEYM